MPIDADAIASYVQTIFAALPAKAKPRTYPDGSREWVPLAGIVLSTDGSDDLECVSLGTGMRCLPASKLPFANGVCLHDWHAETVALRAFNLFLMQECSALLEETPSKYLRRRAPDERTPGASQPFALKDGVRIHMYISEAPCGDASMELTMDLQEDATPWSTTGPQSPPTTTPPRLLGRANFSNLGAVRRKPSRPDAPPTLSKSCSDKLALRQCTSLLSSLTTLLVAPTSTTYLHTLILPHSQLVPRAATRTFSAGEGGRMAPLAGRTWEGGYAFRGFEVRGTAREFSFSRRQVVSAGEVRGSNLAAMWTARRQEIIIGGSVQGNKQFSVRGASVISRARLGGAVLAVARGAGVAELQRLGKGATYAEVKNLDALAQRRRVKEDVKAEVLRNWVPNAGDDVFGLEMSDAVTAGER